MALKGLLKETQERMAKTVEAVTREFATVRTGRASAALVESLMVDCYDSAMPLKQLASISTPEARLIVVQPWDVSILGAIEKALMKADLGAVPHSDGKVLRIHLPQLTEERRQELSKLLRRMAEDGRVSIRSSRRDANDRIKKLQKEGTITEDESFKAQADVQKLTDEAIERIDELLEEKEKDVMSL
jgi:ribosome recycling factor